MTRALLDALPDQPPLVVQLLQNRNITDRSAVQSFLSGRVIDHDPFKLKGMYKAVDRLRHAVRDGDPIAVYGDFDCDGVTATAVLVQVLSSLGAAVQPYVPDRVREGYGLNLEALRTLYRSGVRVVVTADCGIRSVEDVSRARQGMDIIITDHHSVGEDLPPALAVINPKQQDCSYPFKDLSGVGVAFKLAQALLRVQSRMERSPLADEGSYVDLVALGTVADMVPLLNENRSLVRRGLESINQAARPGIEALMASAGLRRGAVDATAIGFRLGPRINAAGRIKSALLAYDLLMSRDPLQTKSLAEELGSLNSRRQEMTKTTVVAAEEQVLADDPEAHLYLVASPDFAPGIVGLAASRLAEAHYRPSVVVELGEEESRGSCRSIPEFNITQALDDCRDLLVRYGGHAAAAGFTVASGNLDALRERLQEIATARLAGVELRPTLKIDAELPLEDVDWATLDLLGQMEPCGMRNKQPVLLSRNVVVRSARAIGSDKVHLKLALSDEAGAAWDAIFFGAGGLLGDLPARIDVAYALEANEWNHRRRLQLVVKDLREAGEADGPNGSH